MRSAILLITMLCSCNLYADIDLAEMQKYEEFDSWIYEAFPFGSPATEGKIIELGKLIESTEEEYSVGHAANPLKSVTYRFPGLEVCAIVEQTETKKAHVTQITISSSNWVLSNGIAIGQSLSVLSKLPVSPHEGTLNYCGAANCIEFQAKGNIINAIKVNLYAD
ncbi:hypothetical protein [Teredinibacter purpureus]|uniref:hypothetical protein n=1 Tax=Teredinibacter purpureus TaxID=2731756 RepID=UPI0013C3FC7F|nr:hypothetical protein [Teredinibacter purpureus]